MEPSFNVRENKNRELTIINKFRKSVLALYEWIQLFKTHATIRCTQL